MSTRLHAAFCLYLGIASTAFSQVGATAESITIHPGAVNAYTYHHCRVLKVEPDGVRIAYDRGTAHIPRKFMPPEWLGAQGMPQPQSQPPQSQPPQTQQLPTQQPPTQPPQSLLSRLQPPPGQEHDTSIPAPPPGFDNTLKDPAPSDNPNISPPFGYFIPVNLADLRVTSPKGWLDGVTNIDGKVYIPNMSSRCPLIYDYISGWYGKRQFTRSYMPFTPYYVELLFRSITFKKFRAIDVDNWSNWYVHQGMATEAQTAEWKRLVFEERICVDMPIEIAGLAFGHHSNITNVGEGMITISNNQNWRVYYRNVEPEKNRDPRYRVVKWEKWSPPSTPGNPPPAQNATVSPPAPPPASAQESTSTRLIPSS